MPHKDPEQKNAYQRAYYKDHKSTINRRTVGINRRRRHERYAELVLLKAAPCLDCKLSFPPCAMDFDHRDPNLKTMAVADMLRRMFTWDTILQEIAKCDLVCACCHRLRTYQGKIAYKTRRFMHHDAILTELKATTPCLDCGGFFEGCQMDFDHVDPMSKVDNIARLVPGPEGDLLAEIAKCHLVCANCHRIRGAMGNRPASSNQGVQLGQKFQEIHGRTPFPTDQRVVPFPRPELLGVVSDAELSMQTGVSREMVAWYRRKAGIVLRKRAA